MSPEQAAGGARAGRPERCLLARLHAVRDACRETAVHRAHGPGDHRQALHRPGPFGPGHACPRCPRRWTGRSTRALARDPADRFGRRRSSARPSMRPAGSARRRAAATQVDAASAAKSIAVLPFADMSPQKDQDYFCEGIAEEIINALSQDRGAAGGLPHLHLRLQGQEPGHRRGRRKSSRSPRCWRAACARRGTGSGSRPSWSRWRMGITSGPSGTIATWRTSSRCRTRSRRTSSRRSGWC